MGFFVLFDDQAIARIIQPNDGSDEDSFTAYLENLDSLPLTGIDLEVEPDCETGALVVYNTYLGLDRERIGQIERVDGVDQFIRDDSSHNMPVIMAHDVYSLDEQARILGTEFWSEGPTLFDCDDLGNLVYSEPDYPFFYGSNLAEFGYNNFSLGPNVSASMMFGGGSYSDIVPNDDYGWSYMGGMSNFGFSSLRSSLGIAFQGPDGEVEGYLNVTPGMWPQDADAGEPEEPGDLVDAE